jgi:hypothetical protein
MAYAGNLLARNASLLAKIEGTYGSDSSPGAVDGVLVVGDVDFAIQAEFNSIATVDTYGLPQPGRPGSRHCTVSFDAILKGSGAAGTPPDLSPLLRACGLLETTTPATSVVYGPDVTAKKSCTIYYAAGGVLHKITGAVGNVSFRVEPGKLVIAHFEMQGLYNAPADAAATAPTLEATEGVPVLNPSFTFASQALVLRRFEASVNAKVAARPDVNAASGVAGFTVTEFEPGGSLSFEYSLVAGYSFIANWLAGTDAAVTMTFGATAGNIVTLALPQARIKSYSFKNENGIRVLDGQFEAYDSASKKDAVKITLT